jgi:SHS2 domain-containing protein
LPHRLLPDVALADIAFRASAPTLNGLFEECAKAMTEVMVERRTLRSASETKLVLEAGTTDILLYNFLTELIVLKDVDSLLFRDFQVRVDPKGTSLRAAMKGEPISRERHRLRNDVKAVTMHMFGIKKSRGGWSTTVVLDI